MANSSGSKPFDAFKTFDVSLEDIKAAQERAKMRAQLKQEWQKKVTNPYRPMGDHVFDPAVQRFMSMKASQADYFKVTPKTTAYGLGLFVIPLIVMYYGITKEISSREKAYRSGKVKYADRPFKFI